MADARSGAVGRGDMRRGERDHRRHQGCVVGEAQTGDDVGDKIEGQDEIGEGGQQDRAVARRRRPPILDQPVNDNPRIRRRQSLQ